MPATPPSVFTGSRAPVPAGEPAVEPFTAALSRTELRRYFRHRRRALSRRQQRSAARALSRRLLRQPALRRARHIALYLPADGEIDPLPLLAPLLARGKHVYLPVLRPGKLLWFRRFPSRGTRRNRFGIVEPLGRNVRPRQLDLVLLPLVAFDRQGGRLGMGGGFYDRSFAFLLRGVARRPLLIGLGHYFQEAGELRREAWDVPLAFVATDRAWIDCRRYVRDVHGRQSRQ